MGILDCQYLSNSKNIASLTVLAELAFIIYFAVPWQYYQVCGWRPVSDPQTSLIYRLGFSGSFKCPLDDPP